jgi:uncharacterized protein (DUF983 family)
MRASPSAAICYGTGMTYPIPSGERDLRSAVLRGIRGCCPACGQASLFGRFLKPVGHCPACGQGWSGHRADDMPAYLVVLALGHILVPMVVAINLRYDLPMWVEMLLWPGLALVLALLLIQPAKGAVIAFQWARRMHGFAGGR